MIFLEKGAPGILVTGVPINCHFPKTNSTKHRKNKNISHLGPQQISKGKLEYYILSMNKYIDAYNSMGNSGFELIDFVFKVCVIVLVDLANLIGISYEAINIIIFVFLQPALILLFFILWRKERRKNKVV